MSQIKEYFLVCENLHALCLLLLESPDHKTKKTKQVKFDESEFYLNFPTKN